MRSLTLVVLLACLSLYACAEPSCTATITAKARPSASWFVGPVRYQIYDITATNSGTCPLTRIVGVFTPLEAGGFISEAWNYNAATGLFSGYGSALGMGMSFYGAGFVLANASAPVLGLTRQGCPDECYPTTSAPTTATPTTATPTTTRAPSSCLITSSIMRDSYSWTDDQGRNTSVYRLSITNNGPCALKSYSASFAYQPGTIVSFWNLKPSVGGYQVTGYGPTLAAGTSFNAAGMILAGAPNNIAITPLGTECAC